MGIAFVRAFKLVARGEAGVACDDYGVALGPVCLIEAVLDPTGRCVYRARPGSEVTEALRLAYGFGSEEIERRRRGLARIAKMLTAGEGAQARVEAVLLALPEIVPDGMAKLAAIAALQKYNPDEPRQPPGIPEGGEWTNGSDTGETGDGSGSGKRPHSYGRGIIPIADRESLDEYKTGDPDQFFDTVYSPFHALAQRLGIDETWLLGLAAHESGYLDKHDRALNDPFGVTHGGGLNVRYPSIAAAVAYWEQKFGPLVRGATSAQDFLHRLFEEGYNKNPGWPGLVHGVIRSIPNRLSSWKAKREI